MAQAAKLLGLIAEAVRSRVQRGTLESEKVGGTVYILLEDSAQTRPNTDETQASTGTQTHLSGDQTDFIASLQAQIEWLRREVERKDTLLMTLMQRVPELEAPREARDGPETVSAAPAGVRHLKIMLLRKSGPGGGASLALYSRRSIAPASRPSVVRRQDKWR